jgi:hypothetical protein
MRPEDAAARWSLARSRRETRRTARSVNRDGRTVRLSESLCYPEGFASEDDSGGRRSVPRAQSFGDEHIAAAAGKPFITAEVLPPNGLSGATLGKPADHTTGGTFAVGLDGPGAEGDGTGLFGDRRDRAATVNPSPVCFCALVPTRSLSPKASARLRSLTPAGSRHEGRRTRGDHSPHGHGEASWTTAR